MIPGDIGAEITRIVLALVAAGDLPAEAAGRTAAGTWRPAPAQAGGGAGTYATSLPLTLARLAARPARPVAALLAADLAEVPWIGAALVTGRGYLTVTVTPRHLAGLAARIAAAGPAAANSDSLAGMRLTAPSPPDPGAARGWDQAWRAQREALAGRLAQAAGADVPFFDPQRDLAPGSPSLAHPAAPPVAKAWPGGESAAQAGRDRVRTAVAYYGTEAVRYALARTSAPRAAAITGQLALPLDLANPFVLVRYAHADAASTLRWAAALGLIAGQGTAGTGARQAGLATVQPAGQAAAGLLPAELGLLDVMSWLQERVAAAARRRRPAELAEYLEHLAGSWLDCRESCPVLPFQGGGGQVAAAESSVTARLGLADAARVALAAGLGLLAISAPERM